MKVLSLFSGVGGFDMGLEAAGMQTVFQCEWDKHCRSVLDRHWANVPKWSDISTLTGKHILDHAPDIDVVAWGSPCQDLSIAAGNKRTGLQGSRSGLFLEGIRIIKEIRKETNGKYPRLSIWENVAGALSSNGGADFGQILYEMEKVGACFSEWRMLDAQFFGIPQRRRRVFVISVFNSSIAERCADPILPVSEGLFRYSPPSESARQKITETTSASIGINSERFDSEQTIVGTLCAGDYKGVSNQYVAQNKCVVQVNNQNENKTLLIDGTRIGDVRVYEPPVQTLTQRMGTGGNNVPMLAFDTQFGSNANVTEEVSPTLKSSQQSPSVVYNLLNFIKVRRLTPIECERLMGWPDNHTLAQANGLIQSDAQRYKQCGNGVASPVAQWIGEQIMKLCYTLEP